MRSRPLFWYIFIGTVFVTLSVTWALTIFFYSELKDFYFREERENLLRSARMLHYETSRLFCAGNSNNFAKMINNTGRDTHVRLTIIDASGNVLEDSETPSESMEGHQDRPEIKEALCGRPGWAVRYSTTLNRDMLYVALPLECNKYFSLSNSSDGKFKKKGVLRLSVPLASLEEKLLSFQAKILLGIALAILFAIFVAFFVSRWISKPLQELESTALRFASGDLDQRFAIANRNPVYQEILSLQNSLTHMAKQLRERFRQMQQQKNQLELVFSSMKEAVIVVDRGGKITTINRSASRLFSINPDHCKGRSVFSAIRNLDMQRHLRQVFATWQDMEEEISFSLEQDYSKKRYFYVHTVVLKSHEGRPSGVLVVMDDLTRMKHLESLRRDFVSNVSHELKTPITSIKAYVETLLDGALHDKGHAEEFLAVIARQAGYLEAIVEDLLCLSRLDVKAAGPAKISMVKEDVCAILKAAIATCKAGAKERNITIDCKCVGPIFAKLNSRLMEQALTNLIVNAVKYSRTGSKIIVKAEKKVALGQTRQILISVQDFGIGIAPEHRGRIFERFYRVDKARSRKLGGTGLGLAIVKHIVQLHRGHLALKSSLGEGSTFYIYLPE